jgi:group I intron endonuclease
MESKNYIYGLIDPRTNQIRYVGKTNNIKQRLFDHIRHSKLKITYKDKWICNLLSQNLKPIIVTLEECGENWAEREIYHISLYENLTNLTKGGEGLNGYIFTEEHKNKISENHHDVSGHNNPMFGKTHTDDVKEKIGKINLGRKHTSDSKQKMSEKRKGEKNVKATLTEADVLFIRQEYSNNNYSLNDLAKKYNVQKACIHKIVKHITWKHI